jgi:glycosyltransferase involved in cell wall biosynthesis
MKTKRVLLISYFFTPYAAVGAKRVSYWAETLPDRGVDVDVVTACKGKTSDKYTRVELKPAKKKGFKRFLIKDEGVQWLTSLKKLFTDDNLALQYDVILISGGPFMHFMIGKIIKRQNPSVKLILDYRDPFAKNPRFRNGWLKTQVKLFFEKRMNRYADSIVSVNNACLALISGKNEKKFVVENGYDERLVPEKQNKGNGFIYAGKLYNDRNPAVFIETLKELNVDTLSIIGDNDSFFKSNSFIKSNSLIIEGSMEYQEVLDRINVADVGLIFT